MFFKAVLLTLVLQISVFAATPVREEGDPNIRVVDVKSGDWVRVPVPELTQVDKATLIQRFYPANTDFEVLLRFSGDAILTGQPVTTVDKTYTYSFAGMLPKTGDKPAQLILVQYIINVHPQVTPPGPPPIPPPGPGPDPKPTPEKSPYDEVLQSSYMTSPNASALVELRSIFAQLVTAIDDDKITGQELLTGVLKAAAKDKLKTEDLKPLRESIATIMYTAVPQPPSPWQKAGARRAVNDILVALKNINATASPFSSNPRVP